MTFNPEGENQSDVEAVLRQHSRFSAHMLSGDIEGSVALMDEAVVAMAPGVPASVGKAAFEERLQNIWNSDE